MREVREVHHEHGTGTAGGMLYGIALVLLVLIVAAIVYFGPMIQRSAQTQPSGGQTNVQVNPPPPPSKVEVNPPQQAPGPQAPAPQVPSQPPPGDQAPYKP